MKVSSECINIRRGWKYYQGVIHSIEHVGHIETDHQVTLLMPGDAAKHFLFPNFTYSGPGMLKEVVDNDTTTRDKMSLSVLNCIKGQ